MLLRRVALAVSCMSVVGIVSADEWTDQINKVRSAIRVTVKQESVSKDQSVIQRTQASQAEASTDMEIYNREQIRKTYNAFGPTGQLVDPCYQISMAKTAASTKQKVDNVSMQSASMIYATTDTGQANAGGVTGAFGASKQQTAFSYAAPVRAQADRHLSRYCSVAEASAGLCQLNANGMQAGDSDFSLHLQPGITYGWDQVEAATDYVKTVAPVHATASDSLCSTIECLSARAALRRREAGMSMSRYSMLHFVESHSTQQTGEARKPAEVQ